MLTIEKLKPVFEDFPVAALLLAVDEQFEILGANDAYLQLLSRTREDLCGRPLFDVFPDLQPGDPQSPISRTGRSIRSAIQLKQPQTPGIIPYPISNRLRYWDPEYIPVFDGAGNVAYIFQIVHENASVGKLTYEHIFETAQNPFFLSDGEGRVLAVNQAACELFGFTKVTATKFTRYDLLDQDDPRLQQLLMQQEQFGTVKGETTGILPGGLRFPCEYSSVRLFNEAEGERYCTEIIDTRKWKAPEENLRAIFNHTVEGFVLVDTDLAIIASNDKANILIFQHAAGKVVTPGTSLLDYLPEDRRLLFKMAATKAIAGEPIAYEKAYPGPDGNLCWYCFSINPVLEGEKTVGLCISGRDITAQKSAEEKMFRSEKRFRGLVENNADAIAIRSADGRVLYVSPAGEHITGFTESETLLFEPFSTVRKEDLGNIRHAIDDVFAHPGVPVNVKAYRVLHHDGTWRWIESTFTNMLHDPAIGGIIDNFRDVTERVEAELRLQFAKQNIERSEEKYHKIFDLSPLPKWIYDTQSLRILEVNKAAIHHYGYSRAEFLNMNIKDLRPAEDVDVFEKTLPQLTEQTYKPQKYWRHLKKDGTVILVDITGHPIDFVGRAARMVICRDVTEQVNAEANLLQSNERFRQAAKAASDAIWDWDISTNMVWIGEGFATLFGYGQAGQMVPIDWMLERLHPDERRHVLTSIQAVLKGELNERWRDEYRFKKADHSYAITSSNAVVLRDEHDKPLRMIGAMKDVTNQKEEEHHLKLLESVITNTTDAVMITSVGDDDQLPTVIYVNNSFTKLTGYTSDEINLGGIALLHGPETDALLIERLIKAMKDGESCAIEAVFYKKDGQPYWASLAIAPVADAGGQVKNYIAIERDITERMNYLTAIEAQNKQLREIAWSQSHIVRAPLARIIGLTDMAMEPENQESLPQVLSYLKVSAEELDAVIHEIIGKANCDDLGE
ncbi:PAS domain S-box protein [Mucilaginibacter sp. HD30]